MNASEKARELVEKFGELASAVVDEIIEALESFGYIHAMYDDFETGNITTTDDKNPCDYWQAVKAAIDNLNK